LVAIDKFTKWIEVKPVTCPKADRVLDFLDELVHRYRLPHRIITDLGSNFNNHQFWEYCKNSGIDVRYVSVAHPRANGQVERANGMVLDALKKRLHDAANSKGGKWIKELPNALYCSGLLRDHVLLDPAYTATNGSIVVGGCTP
jgi:hypothetical protein